MRAPDAEHLPLIENARGNLIEGIIAESEDETLMDRYLAGEEIDLDTLIADLETAVARGSFYPVLGTALSPTGVRHRRARSSSWCGASRPRWSTRCPAVTSPDGAPRDPLACDPEGPLCAEVVKTTTDPYVGRVSLVRVFSGTLRPDATVHVSGHFAPDRGHEDHDVDERVGCPVLAAGQDPAHRRQGRSPATSSRWPS